MRQRSLLQVTLVGLIMCASHPGARPAAAQDQPPPGRPAAADPCAHVPLVARHAPGLAELCPPAGSSSGVALGDFNDDGIGDLAVGSPFEDVGSAVNAGQVLVIYGSANGLNPAGGAGIPAAQVWTQTSLGVPDTSETGDNFGFALAAGDFDDNGVSDLAIGVPGEDPTGFNPRTGQVTVIHGRAGVGLTTTDGSVPAAVRLSMPRGGLGALIQDEEFGRSLAWGDFDGDGVADLAAAAPSAPIVTDPGVPGIIAPTVVRGGGVGVFYGVDGVGLTQADSEAWSQHAPGIQGEPEEGQLARDLFGQALTSGDFDGDGFSDLAVGVPGEDIGSKADAGVVNVIYGSASGLTGDGDQLWSQDAPDANGGSVAGDLYGSALAAGNFNNDVRNATSIRIDDLAIGIPGKDAGAGAAIRDAGMFHVIPGSTSGLTAASDVVFSQSTLFASASANVASDFFAQALASADFDGDGADDLAIGTPFKDVGNVANAGRVVVAYGVSGTGLTNARLQSFDQGSIGLINEPNDRFGQTLSAWNFGQGPQADLAIGVPGEDLVDIESTANPQPTVNDVGMVNVLYGTASGLGTAGAQLLTEADPQVPGRIETGDQFGVALY